MFQAQETRVRDQDMKGEAYSTVMSKVRLITEKVEKPGLQEGEEKEGPNGLPPDWQRQ